MNKVCLIKERYRWNQEWDSYSNQMVEVERMIKRQIAADLVCNANEVATKKTKAHSIWYVPYDPWKHINEWKMQVMARKPKPVNVCSP